MGRPKGSKNKPKYRLGSLPTMGEFTEQVLEEKWLGQKEKQLQDVSVAEKIVKRGRRKKIASTISTLTETEIELSGLVDVESATTRVKKGWINIQRNPKGGFYTGGDIHDTHELAKAMANKNTVCQHFLAFEFKV